MPDDLKKRVKAAYRRYFEDTRDLAIAWNRTLNDIAGNYDPEATAEQHELREKVVRILMKERQEIEADLGDPFTLAVQTAIRDLRRDKAAEEVQAEYKRIENDRREEVRRRKGLNVRKGPKEWTPNQERREEELERTLEREREMDPDDMTLYVMFDDKGGLEGWKIDYPSYWQGHSGPTAAILAHENLDYDEIRSAIEDALGELDWDEIEEELGEGEDAS